MTGRVSEEGFSLVEVIMAVTILGIIGGAVTMSMIIGLRTTDATINRLTDSQDAQLAAAYFGTDVQGADSVRMHPASPACTPDPAVTGVLDLDLDANGSAVSYFTVRVEGRLQLRRVTCDVSSSPPENLPGVVLADNLQEEPTVTLESEGRVKMGVAVVGCSQLASCAADTDSQLYEYELLGTRRAA